MSNTEILKWFGEKLFTIQTSPTTVLLEPVKRLVTGTENLMKYAESSKENDFIFLEGIRQRFIKTGMWE